MKSTSDDNKNVMEMCEHFYFKAVFKITIYPLLCIIKFHQECSHDGLGFGA
jgi:hypothetical protein